MMNYFVCIKKIFVSVLFLIFGLTACQAPKWEPFSLRDYQNDPPVLLRVSQVLIEDNTFLNTELPHIEKRLPVSPAKAVRDWANARLKACLPTSNNTITIVINEASMIQEKKSSGKWYVFDNLVYTLTYKLDIVYREGETTLLTQTISGWEKDSLPKKTASLADKEALFQKMMNTMLQKINDKLIADLPNGIQLNK